MGGMLDVGASLPGSCCVDSHPKRAGKRRLAVSWIPHLRPFAVGGSGDASSLFIGVGALNAPPERWNINLDR